LCRHASTTKKTPGMKMRTAGRAHGDLKRDMTSMSSRVETTAGASFTAGSHCSSCSQVCGLSTFTPVNNKISCQSSCQSSCQIGCQISCQRQQLQVHIWHQESRTVSTSCRSKADLVRGDNCSSCSWVARPPHGCKSQRIRTDDECVLHRRPKAGLPVAM